MKEMCVCAVFSVSKATSLCMLCLNRQMQKKNSPYIHSSLLFKMVSLLGLKHGLSETNCEVLSREGSRVMRKKTMFTWRVKKKSSIPMYCPFLYLWHKWMPLNTLTFCNITKWMWSIEQSIQIDLLFKKNKISRKHITAHSRDGDSSEGPENVRQVQ